MNPENIDLYDPVILQYSKKNEKYQKIFITNKKDLFEIIENLGLLMLQDVMLHVIVIEEQHIIKNFEIN